MTGTPTITDTKLQKPKRCGRGGLLFSLKRWSLDMKWGRGDENSLYCGAKGVCNVLRGECSCSHEVMMYKYIKRAVQKH